MGPLLYAVLYPQPYVGQLIRDIPIAVVDDDNSEISRAIVQALDAHEATHVAARPLNLTKAQAAIARREVFGVSVFPQVSARIALIVFCSTDFHPVAAQVRCDQAEQGRMLPRHRSLPPDAKKPGASITVTIYVDL